MSAAAAARPASLDHKKVQQLEKLFKTDADQELEATTRLQALTVLESELASLQPGARVYKGGDNSVLFKADLIQVKSDIKKELVGLRKVCKRTSSSDLAF